MSAEATRGRDRLLNITNQVEQAIVEQVEPLEKWGVLPYFNFRTQSEQATLNQPAVSGDLLELARDLADLHPESPPQPSLRRAVSTAYYALFHLLISEAPANWARPELRAILGPLFRPWPDEDSL